MIRLALRIFRSSDVKMLLVGHAHKAPGLSEVAVIATVACFWC